MTECLFDNPEDFDEDGDVIEDAEIVCQRCEAENLHWESDGEKWFLAEANGDRHDCHLTSDGFERID